MHSSLKAPNRQELERREAIHEGLCVACHFIGINTLYPQWHHLKRGNKKISHMHTVGLCVWHHMGYLHENVSKQEMIDQYGPSLADGSKPFHDRFFGSDEAMLEYQNERLHYGW